MLTKISFSLLILSVTVFNCAFAHEECLLGKKDDILTDCSCRISDLIKLNNEHLHPLLKKLVQKNYFRFFPVNLKKRCLFWNDQGRCSLRTCAIKPCRQENLPEGLREKNAAPHENCPRSETNEMELSSINKNLTNEQKETIATWTKFDDSKSENFCDVDDDNSTDLEHIDLTLNPERYTGYAGPSTQQVWSAIYNENCFFLPDSNIYYNLQQKRLHADQMCLEGRTFYRLVSGLHTSITVHLCAQYFFPTLKGGYSGQDGNWRPNYDEFRRRFDPSLTDGEGPKWLKNIYFIYLIELKAIHKAHDFLSEQTFFTGDEEDDADTRVLVNEQLLEKIQPFASHFNESQLFQNDNGLLKTVFRDHFRNISHIMDCIGCDKCRLWGKLQTQGLGTSLKILLSNGPIQLQRSEIVSLINAFTRLSTSIYHLANTFKEVIDWKIDAL